MSKRKCIKCEFWFGPDDSGMMGTCQRYAPRATEISYAGPTVTRAVWPLTAMDEFCGEFEPMNGAES